jgi:hypothetical protein
MNPAPPPKEPAARQSALQGFRENVETPTVDTHVDEVPASGRWQAEDVAEESQNMNSR